MAAAAGGQEGDGQRLVGIQPAQPLNGLEIGNDGDLPRHHEGGEEEYEQEGSAGEAKEGEGIGGKGGGNQLANNDDAGHDKAV